MVSIMLVKCLRTKWLKMNLLLLVFTAVFRTFYCDLHGLLKYCDPNQKLCEIPSSYTMCPSSTSGHPEDCLAYAEEPLSNEDKLYLLSLHNKLRSRVATGNEKYSYQVLPPASNMLKLHWDVQLETIAERWTERCLNITVASIHDDCRNTTRFNVTQNIGTIGSKGIVAEKRIFRVFHGWYSKNKLFKASSIDNYFPTDEGNEASEYTNLIWADSYSLGCSRVIFPNIMSDNQTARGVVPWTFERIICNYVPGGNIPGRSVYKRGAPCSGCPMGMHCSIEFPGLCTSEAEMEQNISLATESITEMMAKEKSEILETITTPKEDTSSLLQSNPVIFASETAKTVTEKPETEIYLVMSSWSQVPVNKEHGIRTKTLKLLVKPGIYLNGKCRCPDISRFGSTVSKSLPEEVIKKFKIPVYTNHENIAMEGAVREPKTRLKEGDRCYCKKSGSAGFNEVIPSAFLFCISSIYFFKLIQYIE